MSAAPGWYPDPSGQPGVRFWDGRGWTSQTSALPGDAGAGGAGGGHPQRPGRPPVPAGRRRRGTWLWAVLALVVAVAVIVGVVRLVSVPDAASAGPEPSSTVTGWDETSQPSTPPTTSASPETTERASSVPCPVGDPAEQMAHPADGRIHGGKLSFAPVSSYSEPETAYAVSWWYDAQRQRQQTEPTWESWFGVGQIARAGAFATPRDASVHSLECIIRPELFSGFASRTDVSSAAVTIGGKRGWRLSSEIRVNDPGLSVEGDVVTIVVIDDGRADFLSAFISVVPIGDAERGPIAAKVEKSLAVDP